MKNKNEHICLDDDNELFDIVKKHSLDGDVPVDLAFALCKDTRDFLNEFQDPAALNWSIFKTRAQLRMAIDMLIDAERLALMPI